MPSREPVVAMLDNTLTPYRLHFHQRIARELPVRVLSMHLHAQDFFPWSLQDRAGLELVSFAGHAISGPRALITAARVLVHIKRAGVQAVVVGGYADPVRAGVILAARKAGLACLLFGDSNSRAEANRGASRAKRLVLPILLARCDAVLACGRLGREYFRSYGVAEDRIFISPYEPDYTRLQGLPAHRVSELAAKHGLLDDRRRVVFSGRLSPEKRVDLLLGAFEKAAILRPDWDLIIVGEGPLRSSLQGRADSLGRRVRFLGFVDDPAELAAIYRSSHVLALPSDFEPWGVVVNEALAAGMALVCSDVVGAAADLLVDGRNGRLFRAGSEDLLLDALLEVTDSSRLPELRLASASRLAEWRRVADPVEGLRSALASALVHRA